MAHAVHPDVHTHGLADGCARCLEHAEHPLRDLDDEMLRMLVGLAVTPNRLGHVRSENEAIATARVLTVLEQAGRLAEVSPDLFFAYLSSF